MPSVREETDDGRDDHDRDAATSDEFDEQCVAEITKWYEHPDEKRGRLRERLCSK